MGQQLVELFKKTGSAVASLTMNYGSVLAGLSFTGFALLIPPLLWHIKFKNIPAITLLIWLILLAVQGGVNAIIWSGVDYDTKFSGAGWCDIMIRIQLGASVGFSCSVAAICLNLYLILSANNNTIRWFSHPKRRLWIELTICLATPIMVMGLSYLAESYRYSVVRYSGCRIAIVPNWVSVVLTSLWMAIWATIALVLSMMTLFRYYQKRRDVKDILHCTNSGLNLKRFARLLIFCMLIALVMFPFSIYFLVTDLGSLTSIPHTDFIHSPSKQMVLFFDLGKPSFESWIYIAMDFISFLIFGLGTDINKVYKNIATKAGLGTMLDTLKNNRDTKTLQRADRIQKERSGRHADIEKLSTGDTDEVVIHQEQLDLEESSWGKKGSISSYKWDEEDLGTKTVKYAIN